MGRTELKDYTELVYEGEGIEIDKGTISATGGGGGGGVAVISTSGSAIQASYNDLLALAPNNVLVIKTFDDDGYLAYFINNIYYDDESQYYILTISTPVAENMISRDLYTTDPDTNFDLTQYIQ